MYLQHVSGKWKKNVLAYFSEIHFVLIMLIIIFIILLCINIFAYFYKRTKHICVYTELSFSCFTKAFSNQCRALKYNGMRFIDFFVISLTLECRLPKIRAYYEMKRTFPNNQKLNL